MPSVTEIFMQYVCPSLGTIMASAMFAAPIKSLRVALSRGSLGDLNPTPWAFMTGNCLGWVSYSFVTNNFFVLVSNLPGLILSIWLNIGAAKLQYLEKYEMLTTAQNDFNSSYSLQLENDNNNVAQRNNNNNDNNNNCGEDGTNITTPTPSSHHETRDRRGDLRLPSSTRHEHWVIQVLIVWGITLSLVVFVPMSNDHRSDIIGTVVNLNLIVFYGAPLSTILHVFKTRSSASIHRKTLVMGLLNSFFWLVYGLALLDMVIFLPNACGFILSIIQAILCLVFAKKKSDESEMSEQLVDNVNSSSFDESDSHIGEGENQNLELL